MKRHLVAVVSCVVLLSGPSFGAAAKPRKKSAGRSYGKKAPARQHGQMVPTPDRYREIQHALASKGYLKTEPDGKWDAGSQDALRRFQGDQKLEQTGRLNAKSLTALGLGPAKQSEPAAPAAGTQK